MTRCVARAARHDRRGQQCGVPETSSFSRRFGPALAVSLPLPAASPVCAWLLTRTSFEQDGFAREECEGMRRKFVPRKPRAGLDAPVAGGRKWENSEEASETESESDTDSDGGGPVLSRHNLKKASADYHTGAPRQPRPKFPQIGTHEEVSSDSD